MKSRWILVFLVIAALALAACDGGGADGNGGGLYGGEEPTEAPMTGDEAEVVMRNTTFQPGEITVAPGTTVTWTNEDSAPHTVTSGTRDNPTDLFDSGNVGGGGSFSFTFDEPGTYDYFCGIHPGMDGTVVVEQ